jgi:hypothetical protein
MNSATGDSDRPEWWVKNERLRTKMGLSEYEPPRFEDGTYTHEIVAPLEEKYDCEIRFIGINVDYHDDWGVRINGRTVLAIGRHRDENGNTVYEMSAKTFETSIESELAE